MILKKIVFFVFFIDVYFNVEFNVNLMFFVVKINLGFFVLFFFIYDI